MKRLLSAGYLIVALGLLGVTPPVNAQTSGSSIRAIREAIDESKLVTLEGNTRPEATAANDRGAVSPDFAMNHMLLQLKRSPQKEAALKQYIDQLQDPKSPNFHKWLTPDQFAAQYGVAKADVDTVSAWLEKQGFKVNGSQSSGLTVEFSGTAGQVHGAFHTEIHNLSV